MTPVFDHIRQTKYILHQLLESGFLTGRGFEEELSECKNIALALGLDTGCELLGQFPDELSALRAGQVEFCKAASIYSTLTAYYDFVANKLIIETIP
ncbi:MAG: hypothetical protein FWC73_04440 [Defluviitaleaceae bacterium]|nr:hypothetical protein [Defluviitaleaceae bacterium]